MTRSRAVLAAGLLVALAGCMDDGGPGPARQGPRDVDSAPDFLNTTWAACQGFVTALQYPPGTVDPRDNPAWDAAFPPTYTYVELAGLECQAVSWGTFQGPLRMVIERQFGGRTPPQDCLPQQGLSRSLQSLWVDDASLAAALAEEFDGLQVHHASITASEQDLTHEWTWAAPGAPSSRMAVPVELVPVDGPFAGPMRLHWFNETGVSYLDLEQNHTYAANPTVPVSWGNRLATGHLEPPMLGAGLGEYAALGEWRQTEAKGVVHRFADHFCQVELA